MITSSSEAARLTVIDPGMSTTVQDLGRTESIHLGVSPSGAIDPRALCAANSRVGNRVSAPTLESLLGGLSFMVSEPRWCSVAGARARVTVGERECPAGRFLVHPGQLVTVNAPARGLYTVLAVSGGIKVPSVLGSASCDTLSGIGPPPLEPGQVLDLGFSVGDEVTDRDRIDGADLVDVTLPPQRCEIPFHWGPRDDVFSSSDRHLLVATEWEVSSETNRVGARMEGARLLSSDGTLPSEGIVKGSIQIPPSGQPIVFLADHPVTGGYPVIGVIDEHHLGRFAQVRPGSGVRFRPHTTTEGVIA